jgi:hypothetical protein
VVATNFLVVIVMLVGLLGLIVMTRRRYSLPRLSPVVIVPMLFSSLAILGLAGYPSVKDAPMGASIVLDLNGDQALTVAIVLLTSAWSLLLGALAFLGLKGRSGIREKGKTTSTTLGSGWNAVLFIVGVCVLGAVIVGIGPQNLLHREEYIVDHVGAGNALLTLGASLSSPMVLVLGYTWAQGARTHRTMAGLLAIAFLLVAFGLGSRLLAAYPLLFTLGAFASSRYRAPIGPILAGVTVTSLILVHVALHLRFQDQHGILPYLAAMATYTSSPIPIEAVVRNILTPFAVIAYSATAQGLETRDFWISVDPRLGGHAGWYEVAPQHRLNYFTPMAAVGELKNYGWAYLVCFMGGAGVVLAYFDRRMRQVGDAGNTLLGLVYPGIAILFALVLMSYNLRSGCRYLYYGLVIDVCLRLALKTREAGGPTVASITFPAVGPGTSATSPRTLGSVGRGY